MRPRHPEKEEACPGLLAGCGWRALSADSSSMRISDRPVSTQPAQDGLCRFNTGLPDSGTAAVPVGELNRGGSAGDDIFLRVRARKRIEVEQRENFNVVLVLIQGAVS
jgi:hypothetical protein